MRLISRLFTASLLFIMSQPVDGDDKGVPPRVSPSDYQAHQVTRDAIMAAALVPARQVEKMFSADIARHYIAIEVAIYPQNNRTFDVDSFDFGLQIGDTMAYVEKPGDVAVPWPERNRVPDKPVTVVTEAGVVYGRTSDPVNGRRSGWGTYEGVGVTNDPRAASSSTPPGQGPDPQVLEQRVREAMLPNGQTSTAVAGYLFFAQYKHKPPKGVARELRWSKGGASAILRLPDK